MQDASESELPVVAPNALAKDLYVVGIGASAGGLEAIRELAKNLPQEIRASYVVVQHMSPQHKSLLTTLIDRETHLTVVELSDATAPEANVIYVTPPNNDVVFRSGKLVLQVPSQEAAAPKPSVDRFFISLAEGLGERAVGIVLSGTGSDGAYGVQAIRAAGGITIAQDEQTAKYDGMPIASVETGCVDLVMPPIETGTHLSKILATPRDFDQFRYVQSGDYPLTDLLQILLARTRVDFREYKPATVQRRIERRMTALDIAGQQEYTKYCRENPREVDALFKDLLISVTRFFRDPEEFTELKNFLSRLVKNSGERTIRIWVAGCATGEEVYSIAMMLVDCMGGLSTVTSNSVQIFATDIDREALRVARRGQYSVAAIDDLPRDYVNQYFTKHDEGVRVIKQIRDLILFSDHNICQDPPFLNVDLICCRNLLIYFGTALQSKVLARLHYALNPQGILFLGTAETTFGAEKLFTPASKKAHIYRKRLLSSKDEPASYGDLVSFSRRAPLQSHQPDSAIGKEMATERAMFDAFARTVGPDALLVSSDLQILRVYGDLGAFITLTEGTRLQFSINMIRPELSHEARTLVTLAIKHRERRRGLVHRNFSKEGEAVRLEALPIVSQHLEEGLAVLVFSRWQEEARTPDATAVSGDAASAQHIKSLEHEIETTREALQQTVEELETSNEELQAVNEELQSTNEELQATNEELETSNEELQSTNEELVTVNEELQVNTGELTGLTEELQSILDNVATPILVVDSAFQVAQASKSAIEMFNISLPNSRPHLSQCALPDGFPKLPELCFKALRLGQVLIRDFLSGSTAYTLRCAPFSNDKGQLKGVTLVFMETPAAARLAAELQHLLDNSALYVMHRDRNGNILRISRKSAELFGTTPKSATGRNLIEIASPEDERAIMDADHRFLESGEDSTLTVFTAQSKDGKPSRHLQIQRVRYPDTETGESTVYATGQDITERLEEARRLQRQNAQMRLAQDIAKVGYWSLDLATGTLFWSDRVFEIHGVATDAYQPELDTALEFYHPDDRDRVGALVEAAIDQGEEFEFSARILRANTGEAVSVRARCRVQTGDDGRPAHVVGVFQEGAETPHST